jgi:hypothetical protein
MHLRRTYKHHACALNWDYVHSISQAQGIILRPVGAKPPLLPDARGQTAPAALMHGSSYMCAAY